MLYSSYSRRRTPLTNLFKKKEIWEWMPACQSAFENLKYAMIEELVLVPSNYSKLFEMLTNTLDYAIGDVIIQDSHHITYESCKLNDTKRQYPVHDKKMMTIIFCLRVCDITYLGDGL